jgi:hypothetical protein
MKEYHIDGNLAMAWPDGGTSGPPQALYFPGHRITEIEKEDNIVEKPEVTIEGTRVIFEGQIVAQLMGAPTWYPA